jgi:gamma-glutamyltranspeptidase/glutathione hydrolase
MPTEAPEPLLTEAGVSGGHPAAVRAGVAILRDGGNAVDAAIAAAFADSVVQPYATGIGGGGAALVVPSRGEEASAYDFREVVAENGELPANRTGVPGFVAGMAALHDDHGTLRWAELLRPAVRIARDGHRASDMLAAVLRSGRGPAAAARYGQFAPDGELLDAGDRFVQRDLAASLRTLARQGPRAFYRGGIAEGLTAVDGLDAASLAGYEVARGEPVSGTVGRYRMLAAMPPLPGAALVQQLQVAEALGVAELRPGSADLVHVLASAGAVAFETIQTEMGDPRFVDVPVGRITDRERNARIARALPAAGVETASRGARPVPGNTSHVSVVDGDGLAVSMTTTITSFWGSGVAVGGFFLNDQLSRYEDIGTTGRNVPAPGRRTASWLTPVVLTDRRDRPVLVLGSPGGQQIPSILGAVIARWALVGQPLRNAVEAPRAHADGGTLWVESLPPPDVASALNDLGYVLDVMPREAFLFGSVQALEVDHDECSVRGARDDRREAAFDVVDGSGR